MRKALLSDFSIKLTRDLCLLKRTYPPGEGRIVPVLIMTLMENQVKRLITVNNVTGQFYSNQDVDNLSGVAHRLIPSGWWIEYEVVNIVRPRIGSKTGVLNVLVRSKRWDDRR